MAIKPMSYIELMVQLVYVEEFASSLAAISREKQLSTANSKHK
ncbi:hypothetical protein [Candidatus Tisiphia endosymbiont of Thecophora atra]